MNKLNDLGMFKGFVLGLPEQLQPHFNNIYDVIWEI